MNEKSSYQNLDSEEDRMELILQAIAGAARAAVKRSSDCPSLRRLAEFSAATLDPHSARAVLLHLSSCAACREWESSLHDHTAEQPMFSHNLARLRRVAGVDRKRTAAACAELREWLRSKMVPQDTQCDVPTLPAPLDDGGKLQEFAEFEIIAGPRIDTSGRFHLTLEADRRSGKSLLVVALQDDLRRLEICVLAEAAEITVVADCAFLETGPGRLDPRTIRLSLTNAPVEAWHRPSLLPHVHRIVELDLEPVDCWDVLSAVLAEVEGDGIELLGREIHTLSSPGRAKVMARAVAEKLQIFEGIWAASNHESHPAAAVAARGLLEIADRTEYPRQPADTVETRARVKRPSDVEREKGR
jgi:hypothetical protein